MYNDNSCTDALFISFFRYKDSSLRPVIYTANLLFMYVTNLDGIYPMFVLSDIIDSVVNPFLPCEIVNEVHRKTIKNIAQHIPADLSFFYIHECRIGKGSHPVDFSIAIFRKSCAPDLLQEYIQQNLRKYPVQGAWKTLEQFTQKWFQNDSIPARYVPHIWIGWDLNLDGEVPSPNLCFSMQKTPVAERELLYTMLLQDLPLRHTAILEQLYGYLHKLPVQTTLLYISYMYSREVKDTLRVGLGCFTASGLLRYLRDIDWEDKEVFDVIKELAETGNDQFLLDLDVHTKGLKEGICIQYLIHTEEGQKKAARLTEVLLVLEKYGLCTSRDRHFLQGYGQLRNIALQQHTGRWRKILNVPSNYLDTFAYDIHVIKLTRKPQLFQAKTYFRTWYNPTPAIFSKNI